MSKETKLTSRRVYDGRVVKLDVDEVISARGNKTIREVVRHNGGACVLAVKDGKILLVRQFRYAYGEEMIEIPAGKLEKGEMPEATALRELEEETGLIAKNMEFMCEIYPTPGYTNERLYIYFATDFNIGKTHFDADEDLTGLWVTIDEAQKMIESGAIKDAKTVVAIERYLVKIHTC